MRLIRSCRPLARNEGDQALRVGRPLQLDGRIADVDHESIDLQHPHQRVVGEPAGQQPLVRHRTHAQQLADLLRLVLPRALGNAEEFVDRRRLAVWLPGRVVEEIDAAHGMHGSRGPHRLAALEQGRGALAREAAHHAVDQNPVLLVEMLAAEGIGERRDGSELLLHGAGNLLGWGHGRRGEGKSRDSP
jgi:hypothetical protein